MPSTEIRSLVESDLPGCAEILATRHRADLSRVPHLDPLFAEGGKTVPLVMSLIENPLADGAVAVRGGTVVGFLLGERMLLAPSDFGSQFVPPFSVAIPIEGHGIAPGEDPISLYRALYGFLARAWVDSGLFVHRVAIVPGDMELQEAWVALGFGRYMTAASRVTGSPVVVSSPRALTIERASPEDIDGVLELADKLNAWHWQSPMFWPVVGEAQSAARGFNANALRSGDMPYFVAYEQGKAVAMQTFLRPGFTPPIVKRDTDVYLFEGIVDGSVRGGGIGATLLRHSMAWANQAGYSSCTLHFASGNPSGAPFWLGHGFVPVEHTMERRIDARVAYARP